MNTTPTRRRAGPQADAPGTRRHGGHYYTLEHMMGRCGCDDTSTPDRSGGDARMTNVAFRHADQSAEDTTPAGVMLAETKEAVMQQADQLTQDERARRDAVFRAVDEAAVFRAEPIGGGMDYDIQLDADTVVHVRPERDGDGRPSVRINVYSHDGRMVIQPTAGNEFRIYVDCG